MRVDLPEGAWAELLDPLKVTARARRPARAACVALIKGSDDPGADMIALQEDYEEAATVCLLQAWSYPQPLTVEALMDLASDAHDALIAGAKPLFNALLPSFEADPDPKAPSGGSDSSPAG